MSGRFVPPNGIRTPRKNQELIHTIPVSMRLPRRWAYEAFSVHRMQTTKPVSLTSAIASLASSNNRLWQQRPKISDVEQAPEFTVRQGAAAVQAAPDILPAPVVVRRLRHGDLETG